MIELLSNIGSRMICILMLAEAVQRVDGSIASTTSSITDLISTGML